MKFAVASVLAALASSAAAVPYFTNSAFSVTAGSTFTLTWANATGPVTIVLATGTSDNLKKVETIDSSDESGSYTWSVPTTLTSGNYAFEISDSTGTNYSKLFALTGTGSASASGTSSAAAASSSAASASASSSATTTSSSSSSSSSSSATSTSTHVTTPSSSASTTSTKTTSTSTKSTTTSSSSSTATVVPANTNNGPQAKSPLAFVLVTVAALLYFN